MSTYKLTYFNGRGLAEVSRLIFTVAGQKFEDVRVERDQWPAKKPEMPLGQMPVLEFDGVQLPQSLSIARFLAKQFNLAGKDNFEQAKVDAVVDTLFELLITSVPYRREENETKKEELKKKFIAEEIPKFFERLDILGKLYSKGGPFFVGNQLTWADLLFHEVGGNMLQLDEKSLDKHPWLKQNRAEVEKNPKIAEYLKNRPKTEF